MLRAYIELSYRFGDLDFLLKSQVHQKGKTASCIFWVSSYLIIIIIIMNILGA